MRAVLPRARSPDFASLHPGYGFHAGSGDTHEIGLVGLGRMGAAIGQRLEERGCEVIAWDRSAKAREVAREAQTKRGGRIVDARRR